MNRVDAKPGFWRRLLGASHDVPLGATRPVEVGDRFYQLGPLGGIWVVDRICSAKACEIPHVIIERTGDIPESKMISVYTLLDTDKFRHDRRDPTIENDTPNRRRRTDPPAA